MGETQAAIVELALEVLDGVFDPTVHPCSLAYSIVIYCGAGDTETTSCPCLGEVHPMIYICSIIISGFCPSSTIALTGRAARRNNTPNIVASLWLNLYI
jgi:hypothetical protein